MSESDAPLKAVLAGCGGMGGHQAKILSDLDEFELVAVCDVFEPNLNKVADACGAGRYPDLAAALEAEKPDVVAICTENRSHAQLTIQAAQAGVQGIYCEKPMATNLGEARAMVRVCEDQRVALVINHQRRVQPDLVRARELIQAGAIGPVERIRASCAGDFLTDGTHAVDSILWLAGDARVQWVLGQIHRDINDDMRARAASQAERTGQPTEPGYRYGHAVENGAFGLIGFEPDPAGGRPLRAEILCGDLCERHRAYQDYEIFGESGRIWRTGDQRTPNLFIQDGQGGPWPVGYDNGVYKPVPAEHGGEGLWRPVETPASDQSGIVTGYRLFARMIRDGAPHPMCGANALRGFEVVMSVYESARIRGRIELPLAQERFPLELMIEEGE